MSTPAQTQIQSALSQQTLMRRPDRAHLRIDSDGRRVAYLAPGREGAMNLWVGDIERADRRYQLSHFTEDRIQDFTFCCGGRHLMYAIDRNGDEVWSLELADPLTRTTRRLTPAEGVRATIAEHNSHHRDHVALSLTASKPEMSGIHILNLQTGGMEQAQAPLGFSQWLIDRDLAVRGGVQLDSDGSATILHRADRSAAMTAILELDPDDAATTSVVGFDRSGRWLYLISAFSADHVRLLGYDTADCRIVVLGSEPDRDVIGAWLEPDSFRPDVVAYSGDRSSYRALSPMVAGDLSLLLGHEDANVGVHRTNGDRHWLVTYDRPDRPVRYYAFDRQFKIMKNLGPHNDNLDEAVLTATSPFTFDARDGLTLQGYVTLPAGEASSGQPTVLLVHGGPWSRDDWQFDPVVQWISAVLGFVCLQVNFRGSTGAGKAFRKRGDRQWGRAMNDDLIDTVAHAVAEGWTDPDRVAIMGASYGGYAALMAVASSQHRFRCAIAQAAPTNLVTMLESIPPQWHARKAALYRRIGDPLTDRDELYRMSPIAQAEHINVPVLLADGANDPRIPVADAERIVDSLTRRGVECQRLVFPDDGHVFIRRKNIDRFYSVAGEFLRTHLLSK